MDVAFGILFMREISRSQQQTLNDESISSIQDAILDLWWKIYSR